MGDDRSLSDGADPGSERRDATPGPTHPWVASIVLVTGVVVLIVALALASTFR
jgi:hypothetical protein